MGCLHFWGFQLEKELRLYRNILNVWKQEGILVFIKFVHSEKATKFCEISTLLLSAVHTDKSKVEILQNFVAFSEYMNFTKYSLELCEHFIGGDNNNKKEIDNPFASL